MKGLKALKEIMNDYDWNYETKATNNFSVIEKELKAKEKQDKALEIIRNNYVNLSILKDTDNVEDYNERVNNYFRSIDCNNIAELGLNELDNEQYDLLKEVLENE